MNKALNFFTLFTSFSTLICCALPALLVTLGLGASLAGLVGAFPQIVWVSENKNLVFILGGVLLAAGFFMQKAAAKQPCPIDPQTGQACSDARIWSKRIYVISLVLYGIGGFFAYLAPYFL